TAVSFGLGVYFGACVQEEICDLDNILRGLLAEVLDSVGGNIMEQSRAMLAHRTGLHEPRIVSQQIRESARVAIDDCVRRQFKCQDRRMRAVEPLQVTDELPPTCKTVAARDEELCPSEGTAGHRTVRLLTPVPQPFDLAYVQLYIR